MTFKSIRKVGIIGFFVLFFFMLVAFILSAGEIFGRERYDLDQFSIDTISDEEIAKVISGDIYKMHINYHGGTSTGAPNSGRKTDSDRVRITCEKMFGIDAVSDTKASDCDLVLNINSTLHSGRAVIVITKDDTEVLDRFEVGGEVTRTYKVEGEHIYRVKVLAEDAKFEIETKREFLNFVQ